MASTGELVTELIYVLNADGSQVDDSTFRARVTRALQRACDRAWTFRPLARRLASSTATQTLGVGSVPTNFGSAGDRFSVWVSGTTHEVFYREPAELEELLQRNPGTTSTKPLYYTLKGQSATGRLQIYTYPPDASTLTLALKNYVEVNPTLVDRPGPLTSATGAAGALTGAYRWKVTFVTADGETEGGTASSSLTLTAQRATLTAIPTSNASTVTSRKLYRTAAGGDTFKLVTTLSDNTTTTYTDNTADGSLGADLAAQSAAVSGLEKFPRQHHRTGLFDTALTLLARTQGDGRSAGEFSQSALSALAQMWADEQVQHVPRRLPRYGARFRRMA